MSADAHPDDRYIMKFDSGEIIDNRVEAFEADPKMKRTTINHIKEDFINRHLLPGSFHDVEKLPTKIAIKYNLPPPIANEVAGHIITDRRSVIDMESLMDTVFISRRKE